MRLYLFVPENRSELDLEKNWLTTTTAKGESKLSPNPGNPSSGVSVEHEKKF
jgi:hypothetical protein